VRGYCSNRRPIAAIIQGILLSIAAIFRKKNFVAAAAAAISSLKSAFAAASP
jgi:hypothetical protein